MKHAAVFILLALLVIACAVSGQAQNKGGVPYGHQSQQQAQKAADKQRKQAEKAARKQLKTMEKYQRKQQRAANQAARNTTKRVDHHSASESR